MTENTSFLEKPIFSTFSLNWEKTIYIIIFLLAVTTRFYDVGDRVMSHDESLHALYSYKLYNGDGYRHDPLMHGPFQFHIVALSYVIFGDNDFSARVPVVLFGIALVMLPYWFRPWLGKFGALVASFGLLISPFVLYYQRYIRNEAYLVFFAAMLALCLFSYMRTRHTKWFYIGAVILALTLSTKAVAYMQGFIGVVFIGTFFLWEWLDQKMYKIVQLAFSALALLISGGAIYFISNATDGDISTAELALMLGAILIAAVIIAPTADRKNKPVSNMLLSLMENWRGTLLQLIAPITILIAIFFLLHTTFFTNPDGFESGAFGTLRYWLGQQGVERGSQPTYYYFILMPLYEFLPLLIGGFGIFYYIFRGATSHIEEWDEETKTDETIYSSDGGTFAAYLILWTMCNFIIFSWAGEKMPWLSIHLTVPLIFLMGHFSQTILAKFDWQRLKSQDGLLFVILLPLLGISLFAVFSATPFQGQSLNELRETFQFIIALIVLAGISFGLWRSSLQLGKYITPLLYIVILTVLSVLTIRFSWMANYINYDYVNEFMVYAHGAPDVKWVLDEVDDISRRTVGDKQIKVAYGGVIWPMEWYMREYPNRAFFGSSPNRQALDAPVVIISPDSEVKKEDVEPYLGSDYNHFSYRQVWWPIETYKDLTFERIRREYISPDSDSANKDADREQIKKNWESLWQIFFYRNYINHTLNEWPFRTDMYVYIRKDILNDLWDYRTGPLTLEDFDPDPYVDLRIELPAMQLWGSNGFGDGQFVSPRAFTISPKGELYVADSGNHRIQVFDQNGTYLRGWGGEEGSDAGQMSEPWGIAVSEDGKVYVADTWNHRIQIFDEDGIYLSEFGSFVSTDGNPASEPGAFWGPRDVVIDEEGNVYVSDTGNKRVQKFTPNGEFITAWGGGGVIPGRFEEPVGLAIDSDGYIYVADTWNRRIQKFDANFEFVIEWEVVGWESENIVNKPFLVVDRKNRVFVSDPENYRIIVYNTDGDLLGTFGQFGQDVQSFRLPLDLTIGEGNMLFVLDSENNRIMKFLYPE
ncbi:MAG: hypothetical protein B6242_13315 [Anaerolineaceae bacterium 4572_78]|nr:MAG: hypothetical protein B6242_13315 [Anaerolineaceae bacterium 4572_78]